MSKTGRTWKIGAVLPGKFSTPWDIPIGYPRTTGPRCGLTRHPFTTAGFCPRCGSWGWFWLGSWHGSPSLAQLPAFWASRLEFLGRD